MGSLLLGVSFIALAPVLRGTAMRRLLLALPFVAVSACMSAATGSRFRLPSPSTLESASLGRFPSDEDSLDGLEIDDGTASGWSARRPTLLSPSYGRQWVDVSDGQSAVLKLVARTHLDTMDVSARWLQLLVDGTVVGLQPLEARWRTLAFALPTLEPGLHEIQVLAVPQGLEPQRRRRPSG